VRQIGLDFPPHLPSKPRSTNKQYVIDDKLMQMQNKSTKILAEKYDVRQIGLIFNPPMLSESPVIA